jgi:hypothetical protein
MSVFFEYIMSVSIKSLAGPPIFIVGYLSTSQYAAELSQTDISD